MSMTAGIIGALAAALCATFAGAALLLNMQKRKAEKALKEAEKESKEHARKAAAIIEKANKQKESAISGNHGADVLTMADIVHQYAAHADGE